MNSQIAVETSGICPYFSQGTTEDVALKTEASARPKTEVYIPDELLLNAPDAVIVINKESKITFWNLQAEKIFGWTANEVMNKSLSDKIIPKKFREAHDKGMRRYLDTGEINVLNKTIEIIAINKSGEEFFVSLTISTTRQNGKISFIAFLRDIREQKKNEAELEKKRSELELSNQQLHKITDELLERNNDLEQFSYIVSHNLRGPVANIIGLSGLLDIGSKKKGVKEEQQLIDSLAVSVLKLDEIIVDLNAVLRAKANLNERKESIFLTSLIADIKISIAHIINSENVVIETDFSKAEHLLCVKSYMYSIFYNIISNSIKFRQPSVTPVIKITSFYTEDKIHLQFKDNGKGIDLNKHKKDLFGLYKRFDKSVEGKGMGMFMLKTQVKTLGGNITLKSELSKGTEFLIEFPN